jgi:hypothetical protein
MLKRIFPIALLTGSGQIISLFALKYVSSSGSPNDIKLIGQFDSLVLFLMNGIALGLQTTAIRDLALSSDWKSNYQQTQSARLTLGIIFCAGSLLYFFNPFYLFFLIAPLIALNGDYALYARSHPVIGAWIGFSRLFLPGLAIIIASRFSPGSVVVVYVLFSVLTYLVTNQFISWFLKTNLFARPSVSNLHLYIKSLPLGIVILALYFIGQGLILIIPYFYTGAITAAAYVGIKFYVLFKGLLRIVHQAFIREMNSYTVCLEVDQLASLAGFTFAAFTICFPGTFIRTFFGEKYMMYKNYFILLSLAGLIYSMFSSFIIKAMLEKKDIPYAIRAMSSAIFTALVSVVLSFYWNSSSSIGISLLLGESVFAILMINLVNGSGLLRERLIFFLKNILFLLIPFLLSHFLGDDMKGFLIAAIIYILTLVLFYFRKFSVSHPIGENGTGLK